MASIPELLQAAAAWQRSGQPGPAEQAYRQVLELDPGHAEALQQLGLLAYFGGRRDLAVDYLRRAAEARPADADCRNNLGAALASLGRVAEAEAAYREALRLRPDFPMAHNNLANALRKQGQVAEAVAAYREALRLQPAYAEAHNNLGVVLREQGQLAEAEASCREALRLRPDLAEAHTNLGNVLSDLGRPAEAEAAAREAVRLRPNYAEAHSTQGNALYELGRCAEAEASCREALRLRPDLAAAYDGLGKSVRALGRPVEAEAAFRAALRLQPADAVVHNNLGNALRDQERLAEAEAAYQEALRLRPQYAGAHNNLGRVWHDLGQLTEAEAEYREALRLRPALAPAHVNLAMLLISEGRFEEGWAEYEWRVRALGLAPRVADWPAWAGAPVQGTLLLYAEQGLGDTIQFVRYAALVKQRVGTVMVECQPALIPLLSCCAGIDRLVGQGAPMSAFDAHASLVSLPHILGTSLENVPAAVPYLSADPERVRRWRDELASLPGFKVGIAWQGNPSHPEDRRRSFPLTALAPLAQLPGVHLVVLQKGRGREQLPAAIGWPLTDLGDRLDEGVGAFEDTAAVLQSLDLVVTADSALAHLAGALGRPVWVALHSPGDWRWLLGREDSPWYPSMRLFRQSRLGDWADVFGRMADALRERLN